MRPVRWLALLACCIVVCAQEEVDSEESRKVLGSSVVTSVSVIMDHGNGTKTYLTDAAGQPLDQTEGSVGSPVDLLNPDRYEFYTFDETGDLVKRLMTLDQIKGLLAGGDDTLDGGSSMPTYYHGGLDDTDLEPNMAQGVHSVVANVQNVLRSELKKKKPTTFKPPLSIPDSISSWSMLFPAIISDSSETLDDGNSVNGAIDSGDRLPASSNQENTEVKVSPEVIGKPTAVPPIIHFLEIQSVPSPLNNPTKMPEKTTVEVASTTEVSVTTDRPTSPVNSVEEMSASISSLLSQVTDKQTTTDVGIAEEKKVSSTAMPSSSTESVSKPLGTLSMKTPRPSSKPLLKPESSNVKPVIKKPIQSTTKPHSEIKIANNAESSTVLAINDLKLNLATEHTTTEGNSKQTAIHTSNKEASSPVTKKTTDAVVTFVSTPKPNKLQLSTTEIKGTSTTVPTVVKYQTKPSTPVNTTSTKKTQVKIPATNQTGTALKKPVIKPLSVVDKNKNGSDNLEANGSEEVIRIVPNKASQNTPVLNKIKNENSTSINNTSNSAMHTSKPQKKVPIHKPHGVEDTQDCANSKKATSVENKDKLEVAASTSVNEKVKPTKVRTPVLQEVKTVQKPTTYPTVKPAVTKIKPSEQIKITTYKPSTSQPYTTKISNNKLSSTTERPVNQEKLGSESKIHEVNSSLVDIKENKVIFQTNKTATKSTTSPPGINVAEKKVPVHEHGHSASNTEEIKIHSEAVKVPDELTSLSQVKETTTNAANHSKEPECTHSKKPLHTSIQDKISDLSTHDFAASNSEEVKISTVPTSATEIITEQAFSKESTTELQGGSTELTTEELQTTTEKLEDITTYLPETTTLEMPEMDLVKEGISAVTNILLENKPAIEPQLPIPTLPLLESASNIVQSPPVKGELKHAASFDDFEMTTTELLEENSEKVFSTTSIPLTETELPTTESLLNTNVTVNSNQESTEQVSETSTTPYEETTTEFPVQPQNKETSESNIESIIKNHTLPTKESKLSPEDIEDMAENALPCNHTTHGAHNYTANKTHVNEKTSNTTEKENLEPAQSIISEVNNKNLIEAPSTPALPVETTKTVVKDESLKVDLKPALKTEPPKKAPTRYPVLSNAYRPLQDKPAGTPTAAVELHPAPHESMGLEATTAFLADDVRRFSDLCNELAFRMWTSITGKGSISSRSLVLSPFATTSLLAMVFLGARGPTSGQMNDVLRLDDMVTFNPHQVLQNVTESVLNSRNYGVTTSAFVRELYSDKQKGKILDFYKERAQQYYDGHVEEISFKVIGDILRRRTNLLVKRQTLGKIPEYLRGSNLLLRGPLSGMSANVFQTDCELASAEGRDGEMYFVVRPSTRQRRLVPVPAAVWRTGFLAGYEPGLDATAVALGTDTVVSTILVLPGQQGQVAPGDGLSRLEQRLIETSYRRGGWTRLLRSLLPRPGLELQVPRFSHRSVLNITSTLQRMGLKDLFNENRADLRGLNGLSNDLHLADMVQVNTFSTCGDDTIGARHHIETYPVSPQRMGRDDPELYPRREDIDPEYSRIPLNLRPRQARLPDNPRLRFDRPFLYLVRHNPTGMILYMGRFNPRLLP